MHLRPNTRPTKKLPRPVSNRRYSNFESDALPTTPRGLDATMYLDVVLE